MRHVARSWASMIGVSLSVVLRRALNGPLVPGWPLDFEIGNLFWRGQAAIAHYVAGAGAPSFEPIALTEVVYRPARVS
jgi:hypothetical protein